MAATIETFTGNTEPTISSMKDLHHDHVHVQEEKPYINPVTEARQKKRLLKRKAQRQNKRNSRRNK
jgi:hypothetical protein